MIKQLAAVAAGIAMMLGVASPAQAADNRACVTTHEMNAAQYGQRYVRNAVDFDALGQKLATSDRVVRFQVWNSCETNTVGGDTVRLQIIGTYTHQGMPGWHLVDLHVVA